MSSTTKHLVYIDDKAQWLTAEEIASFGCRPALRGGASGTQTYSQKRPGKSIAMSIHPSQAGMMNDAMKREGVQGVEWDRRGKCIITSRKGRARAMPIFGKMVHMANVHDDDGGYGDG